MLPRFTIEPLPWWTRWLDRLLLPLMHVATGTFFFRGKPQRTHRWHVQPIPCKVKSTLDKCSMVIHFGDQKAAKRHLFGLPICHLPIIGGWRVFVVVCPVEAAAAWHVGWICKDSAGINRIPLCGPVRMLVGPDKVRFFGVCPTTGAQIPLRKLGAGKLWSRRYRHIPLA